METIRRCDCTNPITDPDPVTTECDHCAWANAQPPHTGHFSMFGTYWCDTCNSPYCDLL
jgi:hypothetical protein